MKHLGYLDGWRGLAIGGVLLSHFAGADSFNSGRLGVDLFFVLSGFLMSGILFEERVPLATFYRRRISRIVPVFVLFLVTLFGFYAALGKFVAWPEALAAFTFTRTYLGGGNIWASTFPIGHLWSLNVEEHSYIALSIIAALPLMRQAKGWLLIALAAVAWLMIAFYWSNPAIAPDDYPVRTECASLPLLLAAGYRLIRHNFDRFIRSWMGPVALVLGIACYASQAHHLLQPYIAPFLLAFAVNHIGVSGWASKALEFKPLRMLGLWSFSLYLWQQPFYKLVKSGAWEPLPAALLVFAIGLLSYYAYESPIRGWLNRHWGGKKVIAVEMKALEPAQADDKAVPVVSV